MGMKITNQKHIKHASKSSGAQIFQKPISHLKITSTRKVSRSKFNNKDTKVLGGTEKNLAARGN
jgi:hypothetical protein